MTTGKNISNKEEKSWHNSVIFYTIIFMLVSLFISRGALSVSMILFSVIAIVHKKFIHQLKNFIKDRVLLCMSFLFFIPFVSGLWSSNIDQWVDVVKLKIPLFFMPLAFAGSWKLSHRNWHFIAGVFMALVFAATSWSIVQYLLNPQVIHEQYLKAKIIATPLENDHVRFSWLVVGAIICGVLLFRLIKEKWLRISLVFLIGFFIIYLHILSARMGLVCFYIFIFFLAIRFYLHFRKRLISIVLLLSILVLPFLAWLVLPTFQNRVNYILYDFDFVKSSTYKIGSNDGARINSIKAGWDMLQRNPLGAGAGDIYAETDKWYVAKIPEIIPSDKFYPSNEWLIYGGFGGWPGMVIFTVIVLFFLFKKTRHHRFYWISVNTIAIFSFLFDMGLEVQYGIFLYSFILLWWYKWFNTSYHEE